MNSDVPLSSGNHYNFSYTSFPTALSAWLWGQKGKRSAEQMVFVFHSCTCMLEGPLAFHGTSTCCLIKKSLHTHFDAILQMKIK